MATEICCERCGYFVGSIAASRCPECGICLCYGKRDSADRIANLIRHAMVWHSLTVDLVCGWLLILIFGHNRSHSQEPYYYLCGASILIVAGGAIAWNLAPSRLKSEGVRLWITALLVALVSAKDWLLLSHWSALF